MEAHRRPLPEDANRLVQAIERAIGDRPLELTRLSGGYVGQVYRVDFDGRGSLVAKIYNDAIMVLREAEMLRYLARNSPLMVPAVVHYDDTLVLMEHIANDGELTEIAPSVQRQAAEMLAELHGVTAPNYGHECDTIFSTIHLRNPWTENWLEFYRDRRLLSLARKALDAGHLPSAVMGRIDRLAGRLATWIDDPGAASLIHGHFWRCNLLVKDGRICGFVDPSICYVDSEMEFVMPYIMAGFDRNFLEHYHEIRPFRPGFMARQLVYRLFPALVNLAEKGSSTTLQAIEDHLRRLGC